MSSHRLRITAIAILAACTVAAAALLSPSTQSSAAPRTLAIAPKPTATKTGPLPGSSNPGPGSATGAPTPVIAPITGGGGTSLPSTGGGSPAGPTPYLPLIVLALAAVVVGSQISRIRRR